MNGVTISTPQTYCPYCHPADPKPLNVETIKYSGLEFMLIARGSVLRCRSYKNADDELYDSQDMVLIQYCPMCGRNVGR